MELGNSATLKEAELLLPAASRRSYESAGGGGGSRSRSTRSYTLPLRGQREDMVQKSQSCGGLRTEQGLQSMSTPSPDSPQTHTWKEVREASQILLPECLSSSPEFHSNGLLGFRWLLFSLEELLSLFKSFYTSLKLGVACDWGGNLEANTDSSCFNLSKDMSLRFS